MNCGKSPGTIFDHQMAIDSKSQFIYLFGGKELICPVNETVPTQIISTNNLAIELSQPINTIVNSSIPQNQENEQPNQINEVNQVNNNQQESISENPNQNAQINSRNLTLNKKSKK